MYSCNMYILIANCYICTKRSDEIDMVRVSDGNAR